MQSVKLIESSEELRVGDMMSRGCKTESAQTLRDTESGEVDQAKLFEGRHHGEANCEFFVFVSCMRTIDIWR